LLVKRVLKKLIDYFVTLRNIVFLKSKPGLSYQSIPQLHGLPIIDIRNGASITLGNNVLLRSSNYRYHANVFAPVKLFVDRPNAKISVGNNTIIVGTCIHAHDNISIGDNCLIAANTQIIDSHGHELSWDDPANRINTTSKAKPIHIGDNVWIGLNSIILPGVTIGSGSVIAAGSVVTSSIPPMVVARGNPAQVIHVNQ